MWAAIAATSEGSKGGLAKKAPLAAILGSGR